MVRLLEDSGSESDGGGVTISNGDFKINEEYAKRLEYNKKREELRRLEDKFSSSSKKRKRSGNDGSQGESPEESSSDDEEEDSEAELVTEALDAEIAATLNAIKSKDPRVYDPSVNFYTQLDEVNGTPTTGEKEKPMTLRDYHRENLLKSAKGIEEDDENKPKTYEQEQADLKASIVKEIRAAAGSDADSDEASEADSDDGFLKTKERQKKERKSVVQLDVDNADKDPETFLSNFMSSRAWAAPDRSNLHPFESDDDDEDRKAEEFEEAYNLRFEDPTKSNEKLMSHARDLAAKYSVRREDKSARQKKRDVEKEKKEAAKQELAEDKARLRKLRIEEMEDKLTRIKRAAGIGHKPLDEKDWARFLNNDWDDNKWDEEMQKYFNDEYYAADDAVSDEDPESATLEKKKKKPKKPKWDDDIDIKDLVPEFEEEERPEISLSEGDEDAFADGEVTKKTLKDRKKERAEQKKVARQERQKIEQIVDGQLDLEMPFISRSKAASAFRYRETSPLSYGLTARDILMADDTELNQFAGLKKLASFRDAEKKQKDQKKLGKKARLRQWRKDTFGTEEGPRDEDFVKRLADAQSADGGNEEADAEDGGVDIREGGKKKKRRSKKRKVAVES